MYAISHWDKLQMLGPSQQIKIIKLLESNEIEGVFEKSTQVFEMPLICLYFLTS